MCYSAMVQQDLFELQKTEHAKIDLDKFEALFEARLSMAIDIPKAMEANFNIARDPQYRRIQDLIQAYKVKAEADYLQEIEKYRAKLADAERRLAKKESKTGLEDRRKATEGIEWCEHKIRGLSRVERREGDNRIYPKWYAPVIVQEGNERVIRPMRYLCRPENMPEKLFSREYGKVLPFEVALKGCYNARRDNLEDFWRKQFSVKHGYMVIDSFFENVELHKYEHRELAEGEKSQNLVIHFNPDTDEPMKVACLWSHIERDGGFALDSFAAITDEPPPEVSAAGHDRCLIPLTAASIESWLRPVAGSYPEMYEAMDNRVRPFYEHVKMAA